AGPVTARVNGCAATLLTRFAAYLTRRAAIHTLPQSTRAPFRPDTTTKSNRGLRRTPPGPGTPARSQIAFQTLVLRCVAYDVTARLVRRRRSWRCGRSRTGACGAVSQRRSPLRELRCALRRDPPLSPAARDY